MSVNKLMTYSIIVSSCGGATMDVETRMRINENGRVVIPASYRKALGIKAGDEVILRMEDIGVASMTYRIPKIERAALVALM